MRNSKIYHSSIPEIGEGKRGESGYIGYLLRQSHAAHKIQMERALQDIDLTLPQFLVLTMLAAYPGASGAELARVSLLTPQTISVIVSNLQRDGAIVRRPHDVHGRIQIIEITEAGQQRLTRGKAAVGKVEAALLTGVSPEDESVIRRWLVQIAKSAE